MDEVTPSRKLLLSIDGGGIRGILPICALIKLEETTGKLARETFNFVAGTSTGAIITAGVVAGIPAKKLLELYIALAQEVFQKTFLISDIKRFFLGYYYETKKLNQVIKQTLGANQDWVLNDSPIDLLITGKRLKDGMPWYFVKDNPKNSHRTGQLSLADCVTASAAAPTFFKPWTITEDLSLLPPGVDPVGTLVDGGVGIAGNPVYQAGVEAFFYNTFKKSATAIISLGTGRFMEEKNPGWLGEWLNWVISELMRSPGEQQTELVQRHFDTTLFYRMDPDLKMLDPSLQKSPALDDISNIPKLVALGDKFAKEIDWEKILNGSDERFRVTEQKTQWFQYKWPQ